MFVGVGVANVFFVVLGVQSSLSVISLRKRESWLLYFNCISADFWLLLFCVSSLQSCELVCTE